MAQVSTIVRIQECLENAGVVFLPRGPDGWALDSSGRAGSALILIKQRALCSRLSERLNVKNSTYGTIRRICEFPFRSGSMRKSGMARSWSQDSGQCRTLRVRQAALLYR
jgi:hypothetical protein